jgi:hypothetical protein
MISIRKFVGYTGAAAGIAAALTLATAGQTGMAAAPVDRVSDQPAPAGLALSPACTAALQAIKSAWMADSSEDASERAIARINPDVATGPNEDAAEIANFKSLFSAARVACLPAVTSSSTSAPIHQVLTLSPACTAAIQALKAAWIQGRPTTPVQWQQLQTLVQAVRTACGWSWTGGR